MNTITLPFDKFTALLQFDNDEALYREVAGLFIEQARTWASELRAACADGDHDRIQRLAHTMKGSVSAFQAGKARAMAQDIENRVRARDGSDLSAECGVLIRHVEALADALRQDIGTC